MTTEQELEHVKAEYESLADRLRERDAEVWRLTRLLENNNIQTNGEENEQELTNGDT